MGVAVLVLVVVWPLVRLRSEREPEVPMRVGVGMPMDEGAVSMYLGGCSAHPEQGTQPTRTTKNATATYWQASAPIVRAWNTSWYPKTLGNGSGRRRA